VKENDSAAVWFSPSIEKVGKNEQAPECSLEYFPLDIARNEYEAFQVVVSPKGSLSPIKVNITDGKTPEGYTLPASQFKVFEVNYVPIKEVSDYYGDLTDYPDPIVPVKDSISNTAGGNIVYMGSFICSEGQPAGVLMEIYN
jgi:hypothetical protein